MNKFDNTINTILHENWKSAIATGLMGLGLSTSTLPSAEAAQINKPKPRVEIAAQQYVDMNKLIDALIRVETGGEKNPAKAIGDNGKAKGILQIWDVVVKDVNRIYKTTYVHDDAFDPAKSRDIAKKYLTFWGKRYTKNTGKVPTYEVLAKIWNGGPKGYNKTDTNKYWVKVKPYLASI